MLLGTDQAVITIRWTRAYITPIKCLLNKTLGECAASFVKGPRSHGIVRIYCHQRRVACSIVKKTPMSIKGPYENTEVNYRPSWDLDLEATRNQTQTPPISVVREPVTDNPTSTITRRRNKPTLSCIACVNKKTKCDRVKPRCHACRNRDTACVYHGPTKTSSRRGIDSNGDAEEICSRGRSMSRAADLTLEDDSVNANVLGHSTPSSEIPGFSFKDNSMTNVSSGSPSSNIQLDVHESANATSALQENRAMSAIRQDSIPASMTTPTLLSTLRSFEQEPPAAFNLFRMTSQHPFRESTFFPIKFSALVIQPLLYHWA